MQHQEDTLKDLSTNDGILPAQSGGSKAVAIFMAVAATVIAALQPVVMRYGALNIDPLLFCTVSVSSAAICATTILAFKGELALLMRRDLILRLVILSLTGTFATSLLLIYGLREIDAVAGVILLESEPIYSLVLASLFLGERPSIKQLIATAVILLGIGSVSEAGPAFKPLYAAGLVFLTPFFWQISHVVSLGLMPPLRPITVTGARYIFAALTLIVVLIVTGRAAPSAILDSRVLLLGFVTGGLVYFLGSLTWYGAINRLSLSWTTAFVIPGVPIMSFIFAIMFLGERPTSRELIGIVIAIVGVVGLVRGADSSRLSPAEIAEAVHEPMA